MNILGTQLEGWVLVKHLIYGVFAFCSGISFAIISFYKPDGADGYEKLDKLRKACIGLLIVFGVPTYLIGGHLIESGYRETALAFVLIAAPLGFAWGIGVAKRFRM